VYLGVDEAGKGPVLGPMVAAAVLAAPAALPPDIGDSKQLAPARREAIDATLRDAARVAVGVAFVESAEIDRPDTDMNTLTVCGQARAVRDALDTDLATELDEPVRVVADAGDTSEARFARRLSESVRDTGDGSADAALPAVDVSASHGADEADPVVGAASVVAKVARDARMASIDDDYPAYDGVGSGYPSDPATRSFLRAYVADHGAVPDCARRSWATCDDVLAAAEQSGLDDF
jgi:ribonuclease HII